MQAVRTFSVDCEAVAVDFKSGFSGKLLFDFGEGAAVQTDPPVAFGADEVMAMFAARSVADDAVVEAFLFDEALRRKSAVRIIASVWRT